MTSNHPEQLVRSLDVFGLIGGTAAAAIGVYFAPSPSFDPEGWGYCGISAAYPIRLPEPPPQFGLDSYQCLLHPIGVAMLLTYLAAVFWISGAFASRIGQSVSPRRGAAAGALAIVPAILGMLNPTDGIDAAPTIMVGAAMMIGATAIAYAGGTHAKRPDFTN